MSKGGPIRNHHLCREKGSYKRLRDHREHEEPRPESTLGDASSVEYTLFEVELPPAQRR